MATAGKLGRHSHRDKTLLLLIYRHGLPVSEAVALRWYPVDLDAGLVDINRRKNGIPSMRPLGGTEIRALRKLKHDSQRLSTCSWEKGTEKGTEAFREVSRE